MDITTVDAIPVQNDPVERAADYRRRHPGRAGTQGQEPVRRDQGKPRPRPRCAPTAGVACPRQTVARVRRRALAQGRAAATGRGKPSGEPVSSNGVTGAGHADVAEAGLGLAAPGGPGPRSQKAPAWPAPDLAAPDLAGQGRADEAAGDFAHEQRWNDAAAQERGYPATAAPGRMDDAGERHATQGQWAQDTDPGLDYSSDQDLDYADDSGMDYADAGRDYPADEGWDDVAGPGQALAHGLAAATGPGEDRGGDTGRSDVAGLDQLWGIGRGTSGYGQDQAAGAAVHQAGDVGGPGSPGDTGPGSMRGAAGLHPSARAGHGPGRRVGQRRHHRRRRLARDQPEPGAGARFRTGQRFGAERRCCPGHPPGAGHQHAGHQHAGHRYAGDRPRRDNGRGPEEGSAWEGSAWDSHPAYEAGSVQGTSPGPARDSRRDLPGDFGPDPLGSPRGRETADFLAAPPPSGSILTTAPRQEARTARPANVGTETIAAELAGWAAGELPGQASARLAAWAAIGGVPAPGYRRTDGSDVGPTGVATEPVR